MFAKDRLTFQSVFGMGKTRDSPAHTGVVLVVYWLNGPFVFEDN